jgi:opine dehydrogenase
MRIPKVAVLGAGNVGLGLAGVLSLEGVDVSLVDTPAFSSALDSVRRHGGIQVAGPYTEGLAKLTLVTTDIQEAIAGRDLLVFAVPAYGAEAITRACAPYLEDGQILVYLSCFGALRMSRLLQELSMERDVTVCETMTCPYLASRGHENAVQVKRKRQGLLFAAFPAQRTEPALRVTRKVLPDLLAAKNCLETSINNTNPFLHPTTCVMTAGWIEATGGDFSFVMQGFTPSVVRLQHEADREKMLVADALGLQTRTADEWIMHLYGLKDIAPLRPGAVGAKEAPHDAPRSLQNHRYLLEDVSHGLVPIASIGHELAVPTPVIDAVIELSSIVAEKDLRATGSTAGALGLAGLSAVAMNLLMETGRLP